MVKASDVLLILISVIFPPFGAAIVSGCVSLQHARRMDVEPWS